MSRTPALIFVGPSGVGKNTVAEWILNAEHTPFSLSRSLTTRQARDTFASEYLYVSEEEFRARIDARKMLEYTKYGENYYGTPMSEIERCEEEGKIPFLILNIGGVENIRRDYPDLPIYAVYLYAEPDLILERLKARDLGDGCEDNLAHLRKRMENNREDYLALAAGQYRLYDAFVENIYSDEAAALALELYERREPLCEARAEEMRKFFIRAAEYEF